MPFPHLPLDVLQPILTYLETDRRDCHACALVNRSFNAVITPLLYRKLDSRIKRVSGQYKLYHPSSTLLARPELAKYVRHVTESGAVHLRPNITRDTLHALLLCTNLHSLTWTDDFPSTSYIPFSNHHYLSQVSQFDNPTGTTTTTYNYNNNYNNYNNREERHHNHNHPLISFLSVIRTSQAPLHELTIRSTTDLGPHVWSELSTWTGLVKIGVWCMEGPPRVLQGWAGHELGKTLVDLELGRCAGVPPTILISVLSQLPLLQGLHIKGVPASAVLTILTLLPHLRSLDTEYLNSGSGNIWPRGWSPAISHSSPSPFKANGNTDHHRHQQQEQQQLHLPTLRTLTVRTSSIDTMGPNKLFPWVRAIATSPGLESFRLLTFTTNGYTAIPRGFILEMARVHGEVYPSIDVPGSGSYSYSSSGTDTRTRKGLKIWNAAQAQMTLSDIECVCKTFPGLEELACSTAITIGDVASIEDAISSASNLHTLRLHVQWIPSHNHHHRHNNVRSPAVAAASSRSNGQPLTNHHRHSPRSTTSSPELPDSRDDDDRHDSSKEEEEQLGSRHDNTYFRFSGDTGGRGAFGFDRVGLRYAALSRYMGNMGLLHPSPGYEENSANLGGGVSNNNNTGRQSAPERPFTLEHARGMMLRDGSKLRVITVGGVVYTGKWVWDAQLGERRFEVEDAREE